MSCRVRWCQRHQRFVLSLAVFLYEVATYRTGLKQPNPIVLDDRNDAKGMVGLNKAGGLISC